jgi:hypothetical protein
MNTCIRTTRSASLPPWTAMVGLALTAVLSSGAGAATAGAPPPSQGVAARSAVPVSVSDHVTRAQRALDHAIVRIAAHRIDPAIVSLGHVRRQVTLANGAAMAQIGKPPSDPESDDPPGPPSVLTVLRLDHKVSTSMVGLFDGATNTDLVHNERLVLHATLAHRDILLDAVIGLPPEGDGADYADGMADTLGSYINEVTQLRTALATFQLTESGRLGLANSLTRVKATKAKVDQAFGGGEKVYSARQASRARTCCGNTFGVIHPMPTAHHVIAGAW